MIFNNQLDNADRTKKKADSKFSSSRRAFLSSMVSPVMALPFARDQMITLFDRPGRDGRRDYSVCINADFILKEPDILDILVKAGVRIVWIATFFYGRWPYDVNNIAGARELVISKGMSAYAVTVPFGHPGQMNLKDESFISASPSHWPRSVDINGNVYTGTSIGKIVSIENAKALEEISKMGFEQCMLDDDFRIARSPGVVGGSFDATTRDCFLKRGGYASYQWDELLQNIRERRLTGIVRDWVNWYCDRMTDSFRMQQNAFKGDLGIMVMYLGAEKAGIRLADFPDVSLRVGEEHFNDANLLSPKGWTDELFSVLFHRRFIKPERAWSETTAFPEDALSVEKMCAKLIVSTIADVRHTIFMSGIVPFPKSYWTALSLAMRVQKKYHEKIAGYQLKGPLKHYWGEASRYVGKDKPFSLWLATGIPFEIIDELEQGQDGWVFMSDEDYGHLDDNAPTGKLIARPEAKKNNKNVLYIKENLDALWVWRRSITDGLEKSRTPYISEELPAVCAWYPEASTVLVWNLSAAPVSLTIQFGNRMIRKDYKPLESKLVAL